MSTHQISGKTSICGIIADPVEHTMSPAMHNSAFAALNMDFVYVAFHVKGLELRKAIEGMRGLNIRGLNVSIPHKVAIMQFLDRIDPLAERIGAVNTVVNNGGILTGYNTDGNGFLHALKDRDVNPENKRIVLLGAGGAARAIAFTLLEQKARLTILNRKEDYSKLEQLIHRLNIIYKLNIDSAELIRINLEKALENADILVNATSVGMSPDSGESPVPADLIRSGLVVFDAVYNPLETRLLREAKAAGAITIDGLEMLVWQGVLAFEHWTGQKAPPEAMRQAAVEILKKNEK